MKGLLWLMSGRLASAVLSVISTAVLARLLTPSDFGIVAAVLVVLALANVLFDGAFGVNLVRKAELRDEDVRTTLTISLGLGLVLMGLVCLSAPAAERFFGFPSLAVTLQVSSLAIPFKSVFAIASALLQRSGRFKAMATASLVGQFIGYILLAIPLSLGGAGVWSLIVAMLAAGLTEAVVTGALVRLPLRPAWDAETARDVRLTSLFSIASIMNWAADTGANAVIGRVMGAADLGLYSRGWKLLDLVVAATATPLSRVLLPAFAHRNGQPERLRSAFLGTLGVVLPGYAVASVLLSLQAPLIVELALGKQWGDTVPVVQILFATLVPRCAFKVSENFAMAIGNAHAAAVRQGLYAVLMIVGSVVGVRYGIIGVSIAVSVAITIFYFTSMSYALSICKIGGLAVVGLHVRAGLLAAFVAIVDLAVLWACGSMPMLLRHLVAGTAGSVVGLVLVLMAPRFCLGRETAVQVKLASQRILARVPLGQFIIARF